MPIFNPTTIVGTSNQVLANGNVGTNEAGVITLTLPQSIATTSSPSFSTVTSTVSTGTAPFTVTSTTPVANLTTQYSSNTLVTTTTANTDFPVILAPTTSTGNQSLLMDIQLKYNPSSDSLFVPMNGSLNIGTLTYIPANSGFNLQNSVGTYVQAIIQNSNGSSQSSADLVVNNELSTDSTYYGNLGINSATFTGTGSLTLPNATYLTSTSGDLSIGSTTNHPIHFVINSGATDAFTIGTSGEWSIAGSFGTAGQLFTSGGPSAAPNWTTLSAVTSVGLALPSIFTVSGSPVTTTGTLTGTLNTQADNTVLAGPVSGGPSIPTFRTLAIDNLSDVVAPAPTVGQFLLFNGTDWIPYGGAGAGGGLRTWGGNIVSQTGTSVYTPGVGEPTTAGGTQVATLTLTPLATSSTFTIQLSMSVSASTNNNVHTAAVFRGSTYIGGAIQTFASGGNSNAISVTLTDSPNTVSPITYTFRYGTNANTWYLNRRVAENTYGGVRSGWEIQEY